MTTIGVAHRYFLYLSPIIVQASPSYNLLKPLSAGRRLAVTGLATFMEQNVDGDENASRSRRQRVLRSIRNSVDTSSGCNNVARWDGRRRIDISAEPIYKFRFINRKGWVYRVWRLNGCEDDNCWDIVEWWISEEELMGLALMEAENYDREMEELIVISSVYILSR